MNKQLKKTFTTVALTIGMIPLTGMAAKSYKPAFFDFEAKDLAAMVKVDQSQIDLSSPHVVYCQSDVDTDGEALNVSCYDDHMADVEGKTEKAVEALAFTPAKVDGETVPVRIRFRVVYFESDGKVGADVIPNLGTMQARYGRDYIAPQERLDVTDWYQRYSEYSLVNGSNFFGEGDQSRIAATVNKDGKAGVVRSVSTDRAFQRDAKIVKNSVQRSRFIPGFVNDRAVSMNYIAVVNYEDQGNEAVSSR